MEERLASRLASYSRGRAHPSRNKSLGWGFPQRSELGALGRRRRMYVYHAVIGMSLLLYERDYVALDSLDDD